MIAIIIDDTTKLTDVSAIKTIEIESITFLNIRENKIDSSPLLIGLVFLGSIVLSFLVYSKLVKFVVNKYKLEDKMDPLFGGKKRPPRRPEQD